MKILLAEDERKLVDFLADALKAEGHQIFVVSSVKEIKEVIESGFPQVDVALFDRLLKGGDSLSCLAEFRRGFPRVGILMLSALNTPEEKRQALDLGADDYLGKPFSLVELLARLRAIQRRVTSDHAPTQVRIGNLTLENHTGVVYVESKRLDCTQKEHLLLLALGRYPGQIFSKSQLLDRVWDTQFDIESNVVEVTIKNLRRKLEAAGCTAKILSRRNLGYWIEA